MTLLHFGFRMPRFVAMFVIVLFSYLLVSPWALAEGRRVAFVVGNGAYQTVPQLPNPKNDAEVVSAALRKQGFEVVTAIDLTRVELEKAVERYARAVTGAEISLFYYSGHGIEVGGENRIIPIDATLNEPQDLETQTYSLQTILLHMQNNSQAQLLYLDACRNNPFNDRAFVLGVDENAKPAGKGLAEQKGAIGSLIAYATEPGQTAQDGEGQNSPFTAAVVKHSFTPDLDVQQALMKVTADVWEATKQSQRPWINSTLVKPIYLNGVPLKVLATNPPPMTKTLEQIQLVSKTNEVVAGPVTIGAGPQRVFDDVTADALPDASVYKLMQMPLSGTLTVDDQVLTEGAVIDLQKFRGLKFEPSNDVQTFREANSTAILVPAVIVETAAVAADGTAVPVQLRIQQRMHECDLLAAEPLDLQGVNKGIELDEIDVSKALTACQTAVVEHSEKLRYVYLLGRAQLAAGNTAEAAKLIQKAADAGYIRAYHQLGIMLSQGIGFPKNIEQANFYFKLAADKGDPFGLLAYGRNLVKGIGLKADVKLGIELLKRSAELGNTDALDEMGSLYLYGGALKASPKRAVKFLEASVDRSAKKPSKGRRAIFAGNVNAATDIGKLYFTGTGVTRDLRQAARWYEMGAGLGNQGGVGDLSFIYADGPDELRDPAKAVWYTSLALATDAFRGDAALRERLAGLPDEAKRQAMRDFVNLVGPCATDTNDNIDDTLQLLSGKAWLQRQAENGEMALPVIDPDFASPEGTGMADELKYWNLINADKSEAALQAYLKNFPNGVFADIARGQLGGLLLRVKQETEDKSCPVPVPVKTKKPANKAEPIRLKQPDPPKVRRPPPRPEPPPVIKRKPPPVVKRPPKPPRPIKVRPRRPQIEEEIPIIEEEEPEPDFDPPPRRKLKIRLPKRFPRFPIPEDEPLNDCPNGDCIR